MTHKIYSFNDNILHIAFIGAIDAEATDSFLAEFPSFVSQVPEGQRLSMLIDASQEGRMSSEGRRGLTSLMQSDSIDRVGVINAPRVNRVVAQFVMKAIGRDNIKFFSDEAEARAWLAATE